MIDSAPQASNLPAGWDVASFSELNSFSGSTVNPATRPDEVFELYSVPSFPTRRPEQLPGRAIGSTKQTVRPGDVLVCKINPRINRVWTVGPRSDHEQIASSEWIGFRSDALVPRYAKHYFSEPLFRSLLCSEVSGVGGSLTRAQPSRVAEYPVSVAPLAEQTRIADQLDSLLARIQACQHRLVAIPALLKRFRQAVLRAAVRGDLTASKQRREDVATQVVRLGEDELAVPTSWRVVDLEHVIDPARPLCYGVVQPGAEVPDGVRLIRVQDMESGTILTSQLRTVAGSVDAEYRRSRVVGGEVLVSVVGTIGRTSVVPPGLNANIARAVARIACREDVSGLWVHYWLSTDSVQWHLLNSAKEVARKTLNLSDLARIPIALPEPTEQVLIVERVAAYFRLAEKIESLVEASKGRAQRLAPLTLAKAFRGELVPQDPNDESANSMLARMAAERGAPALSSRPRTSRVGRPPRAPKETAAMTKSRQDDDVMGQPYLAGHLRRIGTPASAEALFKVAELPVADFYKQLAWEVAQGHVKDNQTTLEPRHAAG